MTPSMLPARDQGNAAAPRSFARAAVDALLRALPKSRREEIVKRLRRIRHPAWLGTLRRTQPFTRWGSERGLPVDRLYIERFLDQRRNVIRGRVLEVKSSAYTQKFGSDVEASDVLDIDPSNPAATIIADLAAADSVPSERFDCFILTQTLQLIFDTEAAVRHCRRILRPGGHLLVTVPALSRLGGPADSWRFTAAGCEQLFGRVFGSANVQVESHGNVLAAIAFLSGMAAEELRARELAYCDEQMPLLIAVDAVR